MDVNVYIVCESGVSPWSSIHLSGCSRDRALRRVVGCSELPPLCTAAFPWVLPDALVRSNDEGSLPARLPAVPACMAPTHPFSYLLQAERAEPFLTRGPASSSSCSLSCRGCSRASSVQTGSQIPSGINPGATSLANKSRELVCF